MLSAKTHGNVANAINLIAVLLQISMHASRVSRPRLRHCYGMIGSVPTLVLKNILRINVSEDVQSHLW